MRLWSIHPKYCDYKGLSGQWLEGTSLIVNPDHFHWKAHKDSGLLRYFATGDVLDALGCHLEHVWKEAHDRGYNFNFDRLGVYDSINQIPVTIGQLDYEVRFLFIKMIYRNEIERAEKLLLDYMHDAESVLHPLYELVEGIVEPWEKIKECV